MPVEAKPLSAAPNRTKHRLILDRIEQEILTGVYGPGDRLPSEAELTDQFKVSRFTVARALGELERRGMVTRRAGSGTYVKPPDPGSKSKHFGLLIPGLGETGIFESVCAEMARVANARHDSLLWGAAGKRNPSDSDDQWALNLCHQYVEQGVAGVFFVPLELTPRKDQVNHEIVRAFDNAGITVVLLDRDIETFPRRAPYDLVGIDNRQAGYLVTSHLLERGRSRIQLLVRPDSASTIDTRAAGYWEAIIRAGQVPDPDAVNYGEPDDLGFVRSILDDKKPDAIICGNDSTAAHLLHSLDDLGARVPEDVMVTGFDDLRYSQLLRVPLTTIHQPCAQIGAMAMHVMRDRISTPDLPTRNILLDCELIVRASTTLPKDRTRRG